MDPEETLTLIKYLNELRAKAKAASWGTNQLAQAQQIATECFESVYQDCEWTNYWQQSRRGRYLQELMKCTCIKLDIYNGIEIHNYMY
jgi:hypothetical protein